VARRAWVDRRAARVTLSHKGAKKAETGNRKLRSNRNEGGERAFRSQTRTPGGTGNSSSNNTGRELDEAREHLAEALEQQTATFLKYCASFSNSLPDVHPVFEAIAASATRLCDAVNSIVISL